MKLEATILKEIEEKGTTQDLERAALIFSDLKKEKEIEIYKEKIDQIDEEFQEYYAENFEKNKTHLVRYNRPNGDITEEVAELNKPTLKAYLLHQFLWNHWSKDGYYEEKGYSVAKLIDTKKGNCLTRTVFYSIMGLRNELKFCIRLIPEHIFSLLETKEDGKTEKTYIENTRQNGFGFEPEQKSKLNEDPLTHILSSILGNRAAFKEKKKKYDEAIEDMNKALLIQPTKHNGILYKADLLIERKNYKEAIKILNKFAQANPKNWQTYKKRADVKYKLGKYDNAVRDYNKAIRLNPNNPNLYFAKGNAKTKLNRLEDAVENYDKAIELGYEKYDIYFKKAKINLKERKISLALKNYVEGIKKDYDIQLAIFGATIILLNSIIYLGQILSN